MSEPQNTLPPAAKRAWGLAARLLSLLVAAWLISSMSDYSTRRSYQSAQPAGFAEGVLHGALMPLAMPNLLIGRDVTIYSPSNTGRTYKLGYTLGVNACGLVFFGFLFFRLNRWLRKRARRSEAATS